MQPTPVKTILCPSDSRKPKFSKDGLKRKASGDDSRRKFIKVIDDSVAAAPTSAHRVDVSNVTNHDKTPDPVPNGHSRTAFGRGTVRGEKIFLDLKDGHLIEDLERYIKKFGGVIEKFLSKDITCVVTSRVNVANVRAEDRGQLIPSMVEEKSSKKTECGLNSAAMSRGKALLLRSNSMKSPAAICDPVQFAHTWSIPVVEVTVLRKLLKRENLYRKQQVALENSKESLKKLGTPFVKVEDVMQEYSANFKLFDAFPSGRPPSFRGRVDRDPSDQQAAGKRQKSRQKNPKKPGYCECCDLMFVDRAEHFQSEKHQAFVARSENFTGLDALVSELPSLEMFVQAMEMGVTGLPLASKYGTAVDNVALCCGFLDSYVRNSMLEPPPFLRSVPLGTEYNVPGPAKVGSDRPVVFQESKRSGVDVPSRSLSSGKRQRSGTGGSRRSSLNLYFADKNAPSSAAKSTFDDTNAFVRESPVQKFDNADNSCNNSPVDLSLAKASTTVLAERSPLDGPGSCLPIACDLNGAADVDETLDVGDDVSASRVVNTGDEVSKICDLGAKISLTVPTEASSEIAANERHCVKAKRNVSTDDEKKDSVNINVKCSSTLDCISKEDDLDFSSDEVSDSADDRADWRVALRSSCNKVLDILEDSVSSKGSALDVVDVKLDKIETMTPTAKRLKGRLGGGVAAKPASVETQSLNISAQSSLISHAVQEKTAAAGENISKEPKMVSTERSQDEKCASKTTSGGFVRPWEFVSTKSNLVHQPSSQNTFDAKTRPTREPDVCFSRRSPSALVENVGKVLTNECLDLKLTAPCDGGSKCTASAVCSSSLSTAETYCISNKGGIGADENAEVVYDTKGEVEVERCASPSGTSESSVEVDVEGCDDRSVDLEDFTATSVSERGPLTLSKHDLEPTPSPDARDGGLDARIGDEPLETGVSDSGDQAPSVLLDPAASPASSQPFDERGWKGNVRFSSLVDTEEQKAEQGPASGSCDDNSAKTTMTDDFKRKSQSAENNFQDAEEKFSSDNSQISETDRETLCGNSESTRDEQFMGAEKCEPAGDEQVTERNDERLGEDLQAAENLASENSDNCLENASNNEQEQSFSKPLEHSVASPVNITAEVIDPTASLDLKKDLLSIPCHLGDGDKLTSTFYKTQEQNSAFVGERNSLSSDHPDEDRGISSPHFVCNEENESESFGVDKVSEDPPISEMSSVEISKEFAVAESTAESVENESHDSPLISDEKSDSLPALCASIQPDREPVETSVVSDSAKGEDLVSAAQDNQTPIDKKPHDSMRSAHDTMKSVHDTTISVHDTTISAHDTTMSEHDTMRSAHDATRSVQDTMRSAHDATRSAHDTVSSVHDVARCDAIVDLKLSVNPETLEDNIIDINSGTSAIDVDYVERNVKECGKSSGDLVLDKPVPAEDTTACIQSPPATCTFPPNRETLEPVAEVKAYPDLMDGIDESTNRLKVQMPDLLMPVKSAMSAALSASRVACGFVEFGTEPTKTGVVSDLPFEECQVDFLDQKPGLITLYGVSKDEDAPPGNGNEISQTSLCSHEDRDKDALDPWPDELVDVDRSNWSEKSGPVACAPIATPPYIFFDEEPSAQVKASAQVKVLSESQSTSSLTVQVSNLADSAVLDDDVLTTLSKILEDASKEWQAERQKSKTTSYDRGSSSALNQPSTGVEMNAQSAGNATPGDEQSLKPAPISNFTTNNENSGGSAFELKPDYPIQVENTDELLPCSNDLTHGTVCENNPETPQELGMANSTSQPSINKDQDDDAAEPTHSDSVSSAKPEEDERVDLDKLMDMLRELNGEKDCSDEFEFKPPLTTEGERRGFCETCAVHGGSKSLQDATASFCDRPDKHGLFPSARKNAQIKPDALAFQHIPTGSSLHARNGLNNERDTDLACDCRTDKGLKESKKFLWRVISVSGLKIRVQRFPVSPEPAGPCCRAKTWSANSVGNKELTVHFARSKSNRDLAKS